MPLVALSAVPPCRRLTSPITLVPAGIDEVTFELRVSSCVVISRSFADSDPVLPAVEAASAMAPRSTIAPDPIDPDANAPLAKAPDANEPDANAPLADCMNRGAAA